jgi:chromate transporter
VRAHDPTPGVPPEDSGATGRPPATAERAQAGSAREVGRLFLRLGIVGFGGPAAHIALIREAAVVRRGWLTDHAFLDLLAMANLLPGPTSTEVGMAVGLHRAGLRGMVAAGLAFIAPAFVLVLAIAWAYERTGTGAVVR